MSQTKAQLVGGVGISTADDLIIYGELIGVAATFTGNVSIGGTLTYEDVKNVDSIGIITARSGIEVSGIVTARPGFAVTFYGDGSGLTGTGSTVGIDTTTNDTFYPLFTQETSGTLTSTNVADSKLTFNPSLGKLTATIVNSSSDENLKKDIITIESALDKVKQLRGVDFTWKDSEEKSKGVIAQELKKVLPELVSEENGVLSVNYNGLIAVLIEAVKELSENNK